jgi:hypothetical protein
MVFFVFGMVVEHGMAFFFKTRTKGMLRRPWFSDYLGIAAQRDGGDLIYICYN